MIALVIGCVIGFVLALPPGPVAVMTLTSVFKGGIRHGLWAAAAASTIDGMIALGVLFASSALVEVARGALVQHPTVAFALEIALIAALIVYAIRLAYSTSRAHSMPRQMNIGQSLQRTILAAVITAGANVLNPTFLPTLAASLTAAMPLIGGSEGTHTIDKLLTALGFALGTFGWLAIVVTFIARRCNQFSIRQLTALRRIGAAVVFVFAIVLLWHVTVQ